MNRFSLLLVLALAGCSSASPGLWDVSPRRVEVARHSFAVRIHAERVEATRINFVWPPPARDAVVLAAGIAMEVASGCRLRPGSLRGDAAMQAARLDCEGENPPPTPEDDLPFVQCELDTDALSVGPTGEVYGVECALQFGPIESSSP